MSAADDIPLSTGFGRTSGWIAVHQYRGMPYEEYFAGVERIMDDYDGRPHWGKLHGQRAATLKVATPSGTTSPTPATSSTRTARSPTPTSTASWGERAAAQPTCSIWGRFRRPLSDGAQKRRWQRWRPDTQAMTEHPLRRILERAAGESFPPADGGYDVLPPDTAGTPRRGRFGARLRAG